MNDQAPAPAVTNSKGDFALEPDIEPGHVPTGVIDELRILHTKQNDAATDFREAIKLQSNKFKVKPAALRRYVVALGRDKVDELNAEATDIERLIEGV